MCLLCLVYTRFTALFGIAFNSRHDRGVHCTWGLTSSAFTNLYPVTWVRGSAASQYFAQCPDVVMQPFCRCAARVICRNGRRSSRSAGQTAASTAFPVFHRRRSRTRSLRMRVPFCAFNAV